MYTKKGEFYLMQLWPQSKKKKKNRKKKNCSLKFKDTDFATVQCER